jgi:hypothetical protein
MATGPLRRSSAMGCVADIPELLNVKHLFVKAAARVNNRAENSHQRTQVFLSNFGPIRQQFALKRHLLARFSLSQTARGPIRHMARIYKRRPNSVECLLSRTALRNPYRRSLVS